MQAVAEAWRNITATGARPLAVTDNMNFGNPEKPEIMGQFAAAIQGMAAACIALDFPVVSGNVSLYNETEGKRHPAHPRHRRPRRDRGCARRARGIAIAPHLDLVLIGETDGLARPVPLAARDCRPRGRRAAAGRPGGRAPQRRFRPPPDRRRAASMPAMTCRMAGLLVALAEMALAGDTRLRFWTSRRRAVCRDTASGSARTRPAMSWRPRMRAACWRRRGPPAFRPGCSAAPAGMN